MNTQAVKKILVPALLGTGIFTMTAAGIFTYVFYSPLGRQNDDYHILTPFRTQEEREKSIALIDRLRSRPYEPVSILSRDGLRLCGRYYHHSDGAPLAILCHGYRGTPVRDFCGGADICFSEGLNVLMIEERAHCESEGHVISYGVNERFDVQAWTEYAVRRFGDGVRILLAGISMGAATVLMASALPLPPQVRGILADCPYTSPDEIIAEVGRAKGFPMKLLQPVVAFGARVFGGFSLHAADALDAVRGAKVPILLIHGEADDFVPCEMSRRIADANRALINFHIFPGAGHGLSYLVDTDRYTALVHDFCARIF